MKIVFKSICICLLILVSTNALHAQEINSKKGYYTQIGVMVYMLENLKDDIISSTRGLNSLETDFQFDKKANSIGAIILHVAAVEATYQRYSFGEDMLNAYDKEEQELLERSLDLNKTKEILKDKPAKYYLTMYKKVRKNTLKEFQKIKDDWWTKKRHWSWFHVMEHQAYHLGQIELIIARLPK